MVPPLVHRPGQSNPLVGSDLLGQNHALLNTPLPWSEAIFYRSMDKGRGYSFIAALCPRISTYVYKSAPHTHTQFLGPNPLVLSASLSIPFMAHQQYQNGAFS